MAAVRRSGSGTSTTSMRPPSLPSIPDLDYLDDISGLQFDGQDGEKEVVFLGAPADYLSLDERIAVAATRARARTVVTVASFPPARYASPPPTSSSRSSSTCFEKEATTTTPTIPYPVQRSKSQSTILQTRSPPFRVNTPDLSSQNRPKSVSCLGDLLYQSKALHASPGPSTSSSTSNSSTLESWTITYHAPIERLTTRYCLLGLPFPLCRRTEIEEGRILSITPNIHFTQTELLSEIASDKTHFTARTGKPPSMHAGDLDRRLRCLDWKVQDEIYDLLNDRTTSSSNAFKRREWKVVVMVAVEAGEIMTERGADEETRSSKTRGAGGKRRRLLDGAGARGLWLRNVLRKEKKMPKAAVTEYRLILRGRKIKASEQGWGYYNRYTRPSRGALGDNEKEKNKETGVKRRWSTMSSISTMTTRTGKSERYVDF
ncbi:hypothetical protein QC762_510130 [Podospora pseudocomata]|uniref:DNA2/NAM7 helicase-like C-terminal domain-containing protein n=1 Tax=Podospora pseudocomata TaxID=2093779 RepID=A0ABR0GDN1_9PEZI|nr:hypothetical protein QC762_510130 [Podospora pseudocomata]